MNTGISVEKRLGSFCRELGRRIRNYYADKEHRKEFESWYLQEYGEPYRWKKKGDEIICEEPEESGSENTQDTLF